MTIKGLVDGDWEDRDEWSVVLGPWFTNSSVMSIGSVIRILN